MLLNKFTVSILSYPRIIKRIIVFVIDLILCIFSTLFAFYLRLDQWVPLFSNGPWTPLASVILSIVVAPPIFILFGLYREVFRYSGWTALITLFKAILVYSGIYVVIFTVIGISGVPRTVGIIQPIIFLLLVGASRGFAGYWLSNPYRYQLKIGNIPRVMIYGAGSAGRQLARALAQSIEMRVVGFLDDQVAKHGQTLEGHRIYDPSDLLKLVSDLRVSSVLLAIPSVNRHRRNEILKSVGHAKVSVQTVPSMTDLAQGKVDSLNLRPLDMDDLLVRDMVEIDSILPDTNFHHKTVLVTGAGGSIGSELSRQILNLGASTLVLIEQSEYALYEVHQDLINHIEKNEIKVTIVPLLGSISNHGRMLAIVKKFTPYVIYHAAAYKHVPLVEANPIDGVYNNVFGTLTMATIAKECGVPRFILVSTDKAVRPTNIMGASKRVAEMILQGLASSPGHKTCFSMVRFGNVLNSSGSVVPIFQQQIKTGGPVTITDMEVTRFFMTIPEAALLVIQASVMATGGDVFLLDMGKPVKIYDLARTMIELTGLEVRDFDNPNGDIEIKVIGLRPGEKLYEELLISGEPLSTQHPRIYKSLEECLPWDELNKKLLCMQNAIKTQDERLTIEFLENLVVGFNRSLI